MLSIDDLRTIRELFRPVESDVRGLRRKVEILDRKVERVESNFQNAINRVEKHLKFASN